MKKMAKLLSVLLSISMLAGVSVRAAEEDASAAAGQTATYDFDAYESGAPDGFTGSAAAVKIDSEHGTSVKLKQGTVMTYAFPEHAAGDVYHIAFDYYQEAFGVGGSAAWNIIFATNGNWNGIAQVGSTGLFQCGSDSANFKQLTANKWHRIDMKIAYNDIEGAIGTTVNCYVDGAWSGVTSDIPPAYEPTDAKNFIFYAFQDGFIIDNFRFDAPYTADDFTGEMSGKYLYEGENEAVITFNDTIEPGSFWAGALGTVVATKEDLATNDVTDAPVTAVVDGRKIKVTFEEPFAGNYKYTIYIPDSVVNVLGEVTATKSIEFETRPLVDFYDDFESYTQGGYLKGDLVNGTGFVTWSTTDNKWLASEVFNPYSSPIYGKQALYQSYSPEYTFPYAMDSGKFVVSYDLVTGPNAGNKGFVQLMDGTTASQLMGWWDADLHVNYNAQPDGVALQHQVGEWGHYDLVFDFDSDLVEIYLDNTLWAKRPIGNVTGIRFVESNNNKFALDNFHARHLGENIVTTDLAGTVLSGTQTAYINFRDAVDPATITDTNITILNEDLDLCDFTLENVNWYGAEIVFTEPLASGMYELGINNIAGIRGEELSQKAFSFEASGAYKVSALSVVDELGAAVTSAAAWDAAKAYTVKASVTDEVGGAKTFKAVVAGFANGKLTAVATADFTNVNGSNDYTANLSAVDMAGATSIRLFAIDGTSTLKPLMDAVAVLPATN